MDKKFFLDKYSEVIFNNDIVIVSNKMNGRWIKIPVECYAVIKEGSKRKIDLVSLSNLFNKIEDQEYYKKVILNLENIGLISMNPDYKIVDNSIYKVTFSITNKCNLKCDYCCSDSRDSEQESLSTLEIMKCIDNISILNPEVVVVTGGEPTLRSDFDEIIRYFHEKYTGKLVLSTNATILSSKQIMYLSKILYAIEISLDGFDELSVSNIRGLGVYEKVIKNIKQLKDNGLDRIGVSMIRGVFNENDELKFKKFCERLGVKPMIKNFMNVGRGRRNSERYILDKRDIEYIDFNQMNSITSNRCKAGRNQISIDRLGDVYPCPSLEFEEFKMFNILEDNIEEKKYRIMKLGFEAIRRVMNLKPNNLDRCKNCSVNLFCMPCPAIIYNIINSEELFVHNCNRRRSFLTKMVWG